MFSHCPRDAWISIHAPLTGSDRAYIMAWLRRAYFNPRSPHGERRKHGRLLKSVRSISIHAPLTGSDVAQTYTADGLTVFQSTLPSRGATGSALNLARYHGNFNPRSPHGERRSEALFLFLGRDFNPRSPHGERPDLVFKYAARAVFQSTLPSRGATLKSCIRVTW